MQQPQNGCMTEAQFKSICEHFTRQSDTAQKAAKSILVNGEESSLVSKAFSQVLTRQAISRIKLHIKRSFDLVQACYPPGGSDQLTEERLRFICKICNHGARSTDAYKKALIDGESVSKCAAEAKMFQSFFEERMEIIKQIHNEFVTNFTKTPRGQSDE
ncbi:MULTISPECIES: hypothetical protein [Aeromonas]|nr:hypothetical protein [Aeromonas jandaei]